MIRIYGSCRELLPPVWTHVLLGRHRSGNAAVQFVSAMGALLMREVSTTGVPVAQPPERRRALHLQAVHREARCA